MLRYIPAAVRPPVSPPRSGRHGFALGQPFEKYLGWSPAMGDVVRLIFHGATAALGIHVFLKDTGFVKWFGLFLAAGQGVGAVLDLASLAQRAAGTHPPEPGA